MPDLLGNVPVPELTPSGTFPLTTDFGHTRTIEPKIKEHTFESANRKVTQQFILGNGTNRYTFTKKYLNETDRIALRDFFDINAGGYYPFTYNVPNRDGSTTAKIVTFSNKTLDWDMIIDFASSLTVEFTEFPTGTAPYTTTSVVNRFPSSSLNTALQNQTQVIVPLVEIQPLESGYPKIYVSDRRCSINSQLYQARLLDWDGIQQSMGLESDDASFKFGNADGVMTALVNDTNLDNATISFSLYHVGTGIRLDLWTGYITDWQDEESPEFSIQASDGLYELTLPTPWRKITRTCWKDFNDGNGAESGIGKASGCPFASVGLTQISRTLPLSDGTNRTYTFSPSSSSCDFGFDTPNGCLAHTMENYYGGIVVKPQGTRTKDNSSGVFGFGRSTLVSLSLISDSVYDQVLPIVYTDVEMPIDLKMVAGRDEGDFYAGLGIGCVGPITWGTGNSELGNGNKIDGQYNHGPGGLGLRRSNGHDPVQNFYQDPDSDKFSLSENRNKISYYNPEKAAGVSFLEIRRTDTKGLQLSTLEEHQMQGVIATGRRGWIWTGPGTRSEQLLTNPIWVAVDLFLQVKGLMFASAATCEQYIDIPSAISAAAICDTMVTSLVDGSSEKQFKFLSKIQEEKPLRDWIDEVLSSCLGGYTFSNGKLKFFIRENSSAVSAYTQGNIIADSLKLKPIRPAFNYLTGNFSDADFNFTSNTVEVKSPEHKAIIKRWKKAQINPIGVPTKSQMGRIISTRLREELGGVNADQFKYARTASFKTTILGLDTEPGMVISITHPKCPTYPATVPANTVDPQASTPTYIEMRVAQWRLNKDYSIDITGKTTHNDIYTLVAGPKPADVTPDPVPTEPDFKPAVWTAKIDSGWDSSINIRDFAIGSYGRTVHMGYFDFYYIDESENYYGTIVGDMTSSQTSIQYAGTPPTEGEYILLDKELMLVVTVTPTDPNFGNVTVVRGQLGTQAAAHSRVNTTITTVDSSFNPKLTLPTGLAIHPGQRLVLNTGVTPAPQQQIVYYNSGTGDTQLDLTLTGAVNGNNVYADVRLWRVKVLHHVISFPPRLFESSRRPKYKDTFNLANAGVVLVVGVLENTEGLRSDPKYFFAENTWTMMPHTLPYSPIWPYRMRTFGGERILFKGVDIPVGSLASVFTSFPVTVPQTFEKAQLTIIRKSNPPLPIPSSASGLALLKLQGTGTLTITGTVSSSIFISVSISGSNTIVSNTWGAYSNGITGANTTTDVATSLAAWLNNDEDFSAFYSATSSSNVVTILDKTGRGGTVQAAYVGGISIASAGFTSRLGITKGRRYAFAFTGGGNRSSLSSLSPEIGPSGDAASINISDVPGTSDSRVTNIEIYAAPDGADSPLKLIASVAVNSGAYEDTTTESTLSGHSVYPGVTVPSGSGPIKAVITKNGYQWFELYVPTTSDQSIEAHGFGIDPVAKELDINVDIINSDSDNVDITLEIS